LQIEAFANPQQGGLIQPIDLGVVLAANAYLVARDSFDFNIVRCIVPAQDKVSAVDNRSDISGEGKSSMQFLYD
jgi:hypothetical protein